METDRFGPEGRIGILGGTFDPIHYGHLRSAEEARSHFGFQKVLFIPAADPPHKPSSRVSSEKHRLEMVRLATEDHPPFKVSDVECRRGGKSYSIETLQFLRETLGEGSSLFFLVGSDAFLEITTWKDFRRIFDLAHFVVMERPGFPQDGIQGILPEDLLGEFFWDPERKAFLHRRSGFGVFFRRFSSIDIASTRIRDMVRNGESIKYLLPREVEEYILREGLYR